MNDFIDQLLLIGIITASVIGLLVIAVRKIKKSSSCCSGGGEKDNCTSCASCPLTDKCSKKKENKE